MQIVIRAGAKNGVVQYAVAKSSIYATISEIFQKNKTEDPDEMVKHVLVDCPGDRVTNRSTREWLRAPHCHVFVPHAQRVELVMKSPGQSTR